MFGWNLYIISYIINDIYISDVPKGKTPIELLESLSVVLSVFFVSHTSTLTHLHNCSYPNTVRLTGHRMVRSLSKCSRSEDICHDVPEGKIKVAHGHDEGS